MTQEAGHWPIHFHLRHLGMGNKHALSCYFGQRTNKEWTGQNRLGEARGQYVQHSFVVIFSFTFQIQQTSTMSIHSVLP